MSDRTTLIEGVGDDVMALLVGVCVALLILVYIYRHWVEGSSEVHAESEHLAGNIREQLRSDRAEQINHTHQSGPSPESGPSPQPPPTAGGPPSHVPRALTTDHRCPVCLDDARFCVQTNCGHTFCGQCMVRWWETGRWTGPAKCPACRQQVTLLLQSFTDEERSNNSPEKQALVESLYRYNRRFSGQPMTWRDYLRDLPTLLRHCVTDLFSLGGLMHMFRLRIVICFLLALVYLVSPLDIVPEALFGLLGLLDDVFVLVLIAVYVSISYRHFVIVRAAQEAHAHQR